MFLAFLIYFLLLKPYVLIIVRSYKKRVLVIGPRLYWVTVHVFYIRTKYIRTLKASVFSGKKKKIRTC